MRSICIYIWVQRGAESGGAPTLLLTRSASALDRDLGAPSRFQFSVGFGGGEVEIFLAAFLFPPCRCRSGHGLLFPVSSIQCPETTP
jgi:hypothetical protein